jgi:hypothetical protein
MKENPIWQITGASFEQQNCCATGKPDNVARALVYDGTIHSGKRTGRRHGPVRH